MSRRLGPALAVAGALALVVAHVAWQARGWAGYHTYATAPPGLHPAQVMTPVELSFFACQLLLVPVAALTGWWALAAGWGGRLLAALGRRLRAVAVTAAVVAAVAAGAVGHLVLGCTPISDDEWAYLFHARLVASGRLAAPSEPARSFYDNIFLVNDGRWTSQYPPGHPALLAAGVLAGDPWLVPPLLAAAFVLLLAAIARELLGATAAAMTAALAATSPFLLAVSGTLLAHTACLALLAAGLWSGLRATRAGASLAWAPAAALGFGAAVLVRPSSALAVGVPLALLLLPRWLPLADRWRRLAAFAAVGALLAAVQLAANWLQSGHPLHGAYIAYWLPQTGWRSPFGFGRFPWGVHHTLSTGLGNLWHNLLRLDLWLLGWPLSLLLPAVAVASRRLGRWTLLPLLGSALLSFALHVFYFWPGLADVGPVLYAETMLPWLLLAGAAFAGEIGQAQRWLAGFAVAATLLAVPAFDRPHCARLRAVAADARSALTATESQAGPGRALVFCALTLRPNHQGSWCAGRPNPWPDLRDRLLFVRSASGAANHAFWRRYHPDRTPYLLVFRPGSGFRLQPLDPGAASW